MTGLNALKTEAHRLANSLWTWNDKKSRNKMYAWIKKNKQYFSNHEHISDMNRSDLRTLVSMLTTKIVKSENTYYKQEKYTPPWKKKYKPPKGYYLEELHVIE